MLFLPVRDLAAAVLFENEKSSSFSSAAARAVCEKDIIYFIGEEMVEPSKKSLEIIIERLLKQKPYRAFPYIIYVCLNCAPERGSLCRKRAAFYQALLSSDINSDRKF